VTDNLDAARTVTVITDQLSADFLYGECNFWPSARVFKPNTRCDSLFPDLIAELLTTLDTSFSPYGTRKIT
jgi:hypothetical protein